MTQEHIAEPLMDTQTLSRLLNLQNLHELQRRVRAQPGIFRWFIKAEVCQYIVEKNSHDPNLCHAWGQPPVVSTSSGNVIVVATVAGAERWRYAAPAFMFPLKWTQSPHSGSIPRSLLAVADQVAERLRLSSRLVEQLQFSEARSRLNAEWGLSWSSADWSDVQLSDLALSPESAWAPLTVGLSSAMLDQPLSSRLLATGYWDEEKRVWSVGAGKLASKLSEGYRGGKRIFVVPASVAQNVRGHFQTADQKDAEVVELIDDPQDLYAGVLPGLLQAGAEPTASDPRQRQIDWYLTRPTNAKADQYYYKVLLPAIACAKREELVGTELEGWRPDTLISIVSNSEVLISLAALIFRPKKLKLIYTRDSDQSFGMKKRFEKIKAWLTEFSQKQAELADIKLEEPLIVDDNFAALPAFVDCLQQLPRVAGKPTVLIDTTPGKRAMQLAMLQGTQQSDRLFCWWHDTHQANRRAIPFSEKLLAWEVTADSVLRSIALCK